MFAIILLACGSRQTMHKMAARANRLALLLQRPEHMLTVPESKELAGLRETETYDEEAFTPEHSAFKRLHNQMLVDLASYAAAAAGSGSSADCGSSNCTFFYLDGPGGGTTRHLIDAGFDKSNLFTANWHPQTTVALRQYLPEENVLAARAEQALLSNPLFATQPFTALYIDGCGGAAEPVVGCINALFHEHRPLPPRVAFGFTLTTAERTGRSLADREVDVHRALAAACRRQGYRMLHVADEPELFGANAAVSKREGNTLTSWHMCETRDARD